MSSFYCEVCGALCSDTERGYISGCKHYPTDISAVEYQRRMDKIIAKFKYGDIAEALIALLDKSNKYHLVKSSLSKRKKGKHGQRVSKVTKRVRK